MAGRNKGGGGLSQRPQGQEGQDQQLTQILDCVNETWTSLNGQWKYFGHSAEDINKRKNAVQKHVKELLHDMECETATSVIDKEKALKDLSDEMVQLSRELTLDGSIASQTISKAKALNLLPAEELYLDILKDLRNRKQIRMEKYDKINDKVIQLSEEMGDDPYTIEFDGIPSDAQVEKLNQHMSHLYREKQRRQNSFDKLQKSITCLFECVERIPKNEFERIISTSSNVSLSANCKIKVLSMKVLQDLEELEFSLKHQVKINAEEGEKLWHKILELWSRLTVDEEIKIAFKKVHHGIPNPFETNEVTYKPSALRGLQNELTRLEEEKRRNMALFITQVREELQSLWISKCFMETVDDRFLHPNYFSLTEFTQEDFQSDLYTEDLLEKHETEVEYWRMFTERNKKIIDGIIKRGHMFSQYKILDTKSDDPARLANRGGALLKEEKERKTLEKAIPKLENELKQLSSAFEEDCDAGNGMKKFFVYGKGIAEMIDSDWQLFHEEKEKRKESRKKTTDVLTMAGRTLMTTHLGPSMSRKRPATPSSAQRVGLSTPVKRNKMAPPTPNTGKTMSSTPFAFAQPSSAISSNKKPVPSSRQGSRIPATEKPPPYPPCYSFVPKQLKSASQTKALKLVRKSMGRKRPNKRSSLSGSSSNTSDPSAASLASAGSQFDPVMEIHSLDFSEIASNEITKPATRSRNLPTPVQTSGTKTRAFSKIPSRENLRGKEQMDPANIPAVNSPDSTYSDFTVPLMCQSTLNSSAVSTAATKGRKPLLTVPTPAYTVSGNTVPTPTKSEKPAFLSAKHPHLGDAHF